MLKLNFGYEWISNESKSLEIDDNDEVVYYGVWEGYLTVVTSYSGNSILPDWN